MYIYLPLLINVCLCLIHFCSKTNINKTNIYIKSFINATRLFSYCSFLGSFEFNSCVLFLTLGILKLKGILFYPHVEQPKEKVTNVTCCE